ncbi:hypothetical protein PLANTIT3_50273 [Plantibacter sp. T3]|nr:hypothetical protein PLANTIT3_50273 [Plantibacter sp. T3]
MARHPHAALLHPRRLRLRGVHVRGGRALAATESPDSARIHAEIGQIRATQRAGRGTSGGAFAFASV